MKVIIAGFNLDKTLIDKYVPCAQSTPESISAAYARISRSSKSVNELRTDSLKEIEKSRASNQTIIFEMGHASVAEHAVFNVDIIGISRYLTEFIERSRLASFTEKSQRYVTFEDDFVIPEDLDSSIKEEYIKLTQTLFKEYQSTIVTLMNNLKAREPELKKRDLETKAKEDARYILPLSTKTQLGMTINARNLENLLQRLHNLPITEAQELYRQLFDAVCHVAPSLIRYTDVKKNAYSEFDSLKPIIKARSDELVTLTAANGSEVDILAALLYEKNSITFSDALASIVSLTPVEKAKLWDSIFRDLKFWQKLPRAFEMCDLIFETVMSQCCWAQFKRHRMCSIFKTSEVCGSENVIPPSVQELEVRDKWQNLFTEVNLLIQKIKQNQPLLSNYCLTNSHPVRVMVKINLRELYHFVRLRSDQHAQWEIRKISDLMSSLTRAKYPMAAKFLMGKSSYQKLEQNH
ncbi:MAG: FAD-dependent thymidylate synthase [Candidatus Cloacimonetes bacterium]|nr:FAD-dependent thymidylate synthase [Candidatus Cloacimonadota bacterium]